jgi:hypothetical protein
MYEDENVPQRETQVSSALYRLESVSNTLVEAIDSLESRLTPVRNANSSGRGAILGGSIAISKEASVPLAIKINKEADRLHVLLDRVGNLSANLEI